MNILVTGAYGQLGSELKALVHSNSSMNFIFTDVDTLDICDEANVESFVVKNNIDWVINCAAYTAVDKAEEEKELANKINADAPGILAWVCKKHEAILIHVSTDYVFDGGNHVPYSETDPVAPIGVYGMSKLLGEQNCLEANDQSIIIRTSWLYSSFGNNFVKTMIRLGNERDSLNVIFDQIGSPTYAADLAKSILVIIDKVNISKENFVPGIYHFSNEGVCSWYDFAKAIHEMKGIDCKVNAVESSEFVTVAKRPFYSVLNKAKIKNTFGLEIPYWRDSLKVCLDKI